MSEDGQGGGSAGGPRDRRDGELPPELRGLDAELRGIRFDPRPGLEDRVLAGLPGEAAEERRHLAGARGAPPGRRSLRAAAILALIAAMGLLARAAPDGDGERSPGAVAARPGGDAAGAAFALRWGPDDRVLAVETGAPGGPAPAGREVRCGQVGHRLRCRGASGPARLAAAGGPAVLRDFCCLDYDGGGPADDGVRVVAGQREAVVGFWIYEDRDRTGSFSEGDVLRTVVDGEPAAGKGPAAGGGGDRSVPVRRLDRCCAELDGGSGADDGLFVLAGGGERVALAVLYEDVTGDGRLGPGDRLRGLRTAPVGGGRGPAGDRRDDP